MNVDETLQSIDTLLTRIGHYETLRKHGFTVHGRVSAMLEMKNTLYEISELLASLTCDLDQSIEDVEIEARSRKNNQDDIPF